jgi:hypothetical protein
MDSGSTAIAILSFADAVNGGLPESATSTVKLEVPPAVGIPVIVPSPLKLSPAGRELPETKLQVKGARPPDSCRLAVYMLPPVPPGNEVVVTDGGTTTVTELEADLPGSAIAVAVILTDRFAVTGLGAVKVVEAPVWPESVPQVGAEQLRLHLTPWPGASFVTVAVKLAD